MPTPFSAPLPPLSVVASLALILVACGGGNDGSSPDSSLRCTPNGSTCLGVSNANGQPGLDPLRDFVPAVAALPGQNIDVVLRGASPGETVQVFSSSSLYDRVPQRADDEGEISLTLELSEVRAHSFVVVSEQAENGELPALWRFVVVVSERRQLDPDVFDRAAELIESTTE